MTLRYFYILFFSTLLIGCATPSKTDVASKKKKGSSKEFSELAEEEQIEFKVAFHNASKEKILGDFKIAANLFLKCTQIAPNESAPYYELAKIFEGSKEDKLAMEYAGKAVKLDPNNYWYRVLYARSLQRNGNSVEATKQFQVLIEKNKGDVDLHFDLAGIQLYSEKYKEAIESFNTIEKLVGVSEEISIQKQKIYVKIGDIEGAAREIQKLIDTFPDELSYQVMLADLYMNNSQTEKAFEIHKTLLEKDPTNPYVHLSLYDYHKTNGHDEEASESIKNAFSSPDLDIDTKVKILLSYYSVTAIENDLKKEAMELNKILIETHPNEAKAYTIYADFLYRDNKLESAKENYLNAIKYDSSKFAIWSQLLFIESELQDTESLLRDSKTAIDLFPNQPIFYFFYATSNLQKKNYQEAVDYLTIGKDYVFDNVPLLAQFYANLGDAYNGLKNYVESDKAYEKVLEIEPKNIYVLNNYSYYLSLREEKLDRAEELSALCNELEPDQANYQDTYAWILYKQGKYVQAKEWLEKAMENGGDKNAVILEHLGDVFSQLQNMKKALEYWNKAKNAERGEVTEFLDKKIADKKLYE